MQYLQNTVTLAKSAYREYEKKQPDTNSFKTKFTFEKRKSESDTILVKYPNRIPIIIERDSRSKDVPDIDKKKYLVPDDLTMGQFVYVIRRRLKLEQEKAIFIFVNNILPPTSAFVQQVYEEHRDDDGFLYVTYSGENSFGN